jgi:hypothetical protein
VHNPNWFGFRVSVEGCAMLPEGNDEVVHVLEPHRRADHLFVRFYVWGLEFGV